MRGDGTFLLSSALARGLAVADGAHGPSDGSVQSQAVCSALFLHMSVAVLTEACVQVAL